MKKKMKTKSIQKFQIGIFLALLVAGCAHDETAQNDLQRRKGTLFSGGTQIEAISRTAPAGYIKGGGAKGDWETGDRIWVKDDNGTYRQSDPATQNSSNKAEAVFSFNTGTFTGTTHSVVYTGKNATSATEVEIKAEQTQTATNNFAHLGESGDCGIAIATKKSNGVYKFTLEHKAAYLCIYPRIADHDALHKNVKLTKIVIKSTSGPIAGKYDFTGGTLSSAPTSSPSNTITLTTPSGEIPSDTRTDTCYYVVIAPGNHTLKAEYYIKDPSTNVTKRIVKDLGTLACDAEKFTDVTAWVDKELIEFNSFYMWDAQKSYWYGFENEQPFTDLGRNSNNPQAGSNRYVNPNYSFPNEGIHNPLFMTSSARHIPNLNEISWYLFKGDPRWDAAGVYVFRGHLQQGRGVWIKKMSKIIADNAALVTAAGGNIKEKGIKADNTFIDYRAGLWFSAFPSNTPPTADEQVDCFFLPFTVGYYNGDQYFSSRTMYWTSTYPYVLYEDFGGLTVYTLGTSLGSVSVPFL